jgi:hypothetical protein
MSGPDLKSAAEKAVEKVLTPVERLELSRARMRVFLERRKPDGSASGSFSPGNIGRKMSAWAEDMRANPLLGAVVDAVHNWWATHPLHAVGQMAGDAVEDIAVPWIRRYPLAVAGGALALGAIAARFRPWRWLGKPALFAGLTSQIAAQLMTHAPLEFLLDQITRFGKPKAPVSAAASEAATEAAAAIDEAAAAIDPVPAPVDPAPIPPEHKAAA